MKRVREKGVGGYMTVEAALILSEVLLLYVFLIRSFFLIYDRCLLEQDMAALTMSCVYESTEDLERVWQQETKAWDTTKYLWIAPKEPTLQKKGWKLMVEGSAIGEQAGDLKVSYEIWRMVPEDWLRTKRKAEQRLESSREEKQ